MTQEEHDVLDRVIAGKDAQIERLQGELRKVETLWFSEHYRLRELLVRAADALDRPETRAYMQQWVESLIAELRKVAE